VSPAEAGYAGYARMIKLHDGTLFCVFESDGNTQAVTSNDGGEHWSEPVMIAARENDIARAVPEVLQLQNQSILVSYNLRPTGNNTNPDKRFAIQVKRSDDGGKHWSSPVQVYTAGHEFKNGCWEPAQIQLPSGEIQLYIANEGPYTQSDEQEITMFRSVDNGTTWTAGEKVSFRSGYRDGMPVPLLLQNKQTILFAERI
jgi:Neuraminidase (sialidase)